MTTDARAPNGGASARQFLGPAYRFSPNNRTIPDDTSLDIRFERLPVKGIAPEP
jgi:hypothetical protein